MRRLSKCCAAAAAGLLLTVGIIAGVSCQREGAGNETSPPLAAPPTVRPAREKVVAERTAADEIAERLQARRAPEAAATLIARLRDGALPEKLRAAAATDLARTGTDEAMTALRGVLNDASASSSLKAVIAEALGECPHLEARDLLLKLLESSDEAIARGAVRGLGLRDDAAAVEVLSALLRDERKTTTLRGEAALALGASEHPAAFSALQSALAGATDQPAFARDILEGMGRRPFEETQFFFTGLLQEQNVPAHLRVSALEALAQTDGNANALLLTYAKDADPQARAAAAWALAGAEHRDGLAPSLVGLLQNEADAQVRLRLYQALAHETDFDFPAVQQRVAAEQNIDAKLAGYSALARATANPEAALSFDTHAVPDLERTASAGANLQQRLASVLALQRARTPGARAALSNLAQSSGDTRVVEAARSALNRPGGNQP